MRIDLKTSAALARLTGQAPELMRRAGLLAAKRAAEDYVEAINDWIGEGRSFKPRTGRLEQATGWRPTATGAEVFAQAPYAPFVEFGTQAHLIRPKPGRKALRWFRGGAGGGQTIRRAVHHPGTRPLRFFFADLERRQAAMHEAAREALAEVLLGSGGGAHA
jgi:hypothetical protein